MRKKICTLVFLGLCGTLCAQETKPEKDTPTVLTFTPRFYNAGPCGCPSQSLEPGQTSPDQNPYRFDQPPTIVLDSIPNWQRPYKQEEETLLP